MERKKIAEAKRIVVKVGTSTITYPNGKINYEKIEKMARILTDFQNQGREMILVSSGAGAAGVGRMGLEAKPKTIPGKQACAAVGQGILMHIYERIFGEYGQVVAQVLLTKNDMVNRHSYANARNALQEMISWGVIPIINENDVVAIDEFKIGDNDNLSALVASLADADLDILLSDIDGLYTANPKTHPDAKLVSVVEEVTPEIEATAGGAGSRNATGGMLTKLQAAKNAMSAGIALIIANGEHLEILRNILRGEPVGTLFVPKESHLRFRNQWLAFGSRISGKLIVDAGLAKALRQEGSCSILPVGIVGVEGEFDSGDTVSVVDQEGHELARGMTNYGSGDVALIKGCKTSQIEARIGYKHYDEVIHRDNLVVL
ncbi:glutamate 5-kinase [Acidaminococcus timonensis]|jgi:glutamate 5-kinase|uniref:glutamate 5-kinase n=1 Tax=Acidaminococcus timonensis TaxID=1871002 RepID=UPI0008DB26FE|nr:glutamate 5-kinase [Acidaminococcus timonensis]